jgi:signal peptidase I
VTTTEPPNPYAPSAAPAHEAAVEKGARQWPVWLLAAITTFLAFPLIGAGFFIIGRRRPLIAWVTVGVVLLATAIIAARLPVPRLCVGGFVAAYLAALLAIIHTAVAKPDTPLRGGRAVVVAIALILGAKGAGLVVRYTLVEAFQVPSGSNLPTLLVGDHIFAKKGNGAVARGDVIVFKYPPDPRTDYIKRVVAIGGDTIEVKGGVPAINGVPLAHQPIDGPCAYRDPSATGDGEHSCTLVRETNAGRSYTIMLMSSTHAQDLDRTIIPPGQVFVIGDNRDNSSDSRR